MESSACVGSAVGLLEANECAGAELGGLLGALFLSWLDDLNGLDLTKRCEDLVEVGLGVLLGEVLHEEVALLLGVLVAGLLAEDLGVALFAGDGRLHVDLGIVELLFVEVLDGFIGASGTVGAVTVLVVADEGEWLLKAILALLGHLDEGLDLTVLAEDFLEVGLGPGGGVVLHVNVVVDLASLTGVFGLVFDDIHAFDGLGIYGLLGVLLALEADETVSILGGGKGLVLNSEGDLGGLDGAELSGEDGVEVLGVHVVVNGLNEDVELGVSSELVGSEELSVEGESAALPLSGLITVGELEVLDSLSNLGELSCVNLDDAVAEG